jgi:uncharacterized protein (DUF885 family)
LKFRRRDLMGAAAAAGALAAAPRVVAAAPATPASEDAKLDALLQRQFDENLDRSPENATGLGLDKGARAPLRWKLEDRSLAENERDRRDAQRRWAELQGIDRGKLSRTGALNYDVAAFRASHAAAAAKRFAYGAMAGRAAPYVLSQLTGAYYSVPDFLANQHKIETKDDADAYLSRLTAFATVLDQQTEVVKHDAGLGVIPPDFVLAKTIGNLEKLRAAAPTESVLVRSVADRAKAKGLGDYETPAAKVFAGPVAAALDRQIAALKALQPKTVHDAGVWRLPDGEACYQAGIVASTTTTYTGDEIHRLGLEQVADLQARLDPMLKAQGLTEGTLGARLAALNADPRYVYPNTDAGKAELLTHLNQLVADLRPHLPQAFRTLPKADLEIRRVPAYIEAGAPLGYYQGAPLDNSRPGAYYINLKDTADWPKWSLPTLTYHEGIPGHHFQISVSREAGELPIYRRVGGFSAYNEGWALYAEQVADELGVYENDPLGRIGFLQSLLFRACRLVVDSGVHAKRWSREQAVRYMVDNCGRTEGASINEVERYCVWPGQACSYKLGHTVITRIRADAQGKLGSRFDLKAFHDAVLLNGSLPLSVLETSVGDWTAAQLKAA